MNCCFSWYRLIYTLFLCCCPPEYPPVFHLCLVSLILICCTCVDLHIRLCRPLSQHSEEAVGSTFPPKTLHFLSVTNTKDWHGLRFILNIFWTSWLLNCLENLQIFDWRQEISVALGGGLFMAVACGRDSSEVTCVGTVHHTL